MTFEAVSPAESSVVQGAPISEEADQGLSPGFSLDLLYDLPSSLIIYELNHIFDVLILFV